MVAKKKKARKQKLRITTVSKKFCGITHDKRMYDKTKTHVPPDVRKNADLAFLETSLTTPIKKPKTGELTDQ